MSVKLAFRSTGVYAIKTLLVLVAGVVLGLTALGLVHLIPVERMYQNAQVSKEMISEQGTTYSLYEFNSAILDNYTDSIMVSTAICPVDAPILEKVIYNYHVSYFKGYLEQENLERYLNGEEGYSYSNYSHYWNGYLIFLKPLLYLFEYNDIIMLNVILQTLLAVSAAAGMVRKKKEFLILPFMVTFLSMMPSAMAASIQYADVIYIALTGANIIIWKYEKLDRKKNYLLFLMLGMATSYFDFLTYPLVSLGIPLVIYAVCREEGKPFEGLLSCIVSSIGWSLGYVGMWVSKGAVGSLLCPDSRALETGIEHFFWRSSETVSTGSIGFLDVVIKNMFVYLNWPVLLLIVLTAGYFLIKALAGKNITKANLLKVLPCLMILFYPFVWFFLLKNHSYEHAFMVYRDLAIAVFAGLSLLAFLGRAKRG